MTVFIYRRPLLFTLLFAVLTFGFLSWQPLWTAHFAIDPCERGSGLPMRWKVPSGWVADCDFHRANMMWSVRDHFWAMADSCEVAFRQPYNWPVGAFDTYFKSQFLLAGGILFVAFAAGGLIAFGVRGWYRWSGIAPVPADPPLHRRPLPFAILCAAIVFAAASCMEVWEAQYFRQTWACDAPGGPWFGLDRTFWEMTWTAIPYLNEDGFVLARFLFQHELLKIWLVLLSGAVVGWLVAATLRWRHRRAEEEAELAEMEARCGRLA
jgi:hypothetical protein